VTDPIVLPDKMPSSAAADLSRALDTAAADLAPGAEIRIEAGDVRTIGALAAGLVLRFARDVEAGGGRVEIASSADFEDDLRLLGLHDLLLRKDPVT